MHSNEKKIFSGKNQKPQNIMEILFMICSWMMGVFFFSILVGWYVVIFLSIPIFLFTGNIRDILGTAMRNRNEYRRRLDAVSNYMQKFKVNDYNVFPYYTVV